MDQATTQLYISLLEKTNQQLSLWSNPYGVLVAVLSFLVAFLAIAAAVILYRQTKEHRELFQKALKDYELALQKNLEQTGVDAETKIQKFIDTKTGEINALSGDTKKQAKKIIDDLKKEKDSIGSRIQFSSVQANQFQPLTVSTAKFNNPFNINSAENISGINFTTNTGYCSKCGTYNGSNGILLTTHNYCSNCGNKL